MSDCRRIPGDEVVAMAREAGFALAGVCPARPSDYADELRGWLQRGEHGSMAYLERNVEQRIDPGSMLDGARSIVMVADQYGRRGGATLEDNPVEGEGRIARYARGRDYHVVMKKRLHAMCDALRERFPQERFRAFVDTAPVLEREHAARAGLGWIGKHTLLINPRIGSWIFLGGIMTSLEIDPPASRQRSVEDHCGTCTRCIDACPTDAISPYSVNASRCISYLTIERRLPIDESFHGAVGDWIFGCDICQEVCPHNSARSDGVEVGEAHEAYTQGRSSFDLLEVLGWTEDDRREAFTRSSMKRATLAMMKRNAVIVAGNTGSSGDDRLAARLRSIAEDADEPEMVRVAAGRALERIEARRG